MASVLNIDTRRNKTSNNPTITNNVTVVNDTSKLNEICKEPTEDIKVVYKHREKPVNDSAWDDVVENTKHLPAENEISYVCSVATLKDDPINYLWLWASRLKSISTEPKILQISKLKRLIADLLDYNIVDINIEVEDCGCLQGNQRNIIRIEHFVGKNIENLNVNSKLERCLALINVSMKQCLCC